MLFNINFSKVSNTKIMYYSYHNEAKKLIREGHLTDFFFAKKYNHIKPALVLVFDNHIPMPIREYKWEEYLTFIKEIQSCSQN